MSLNQLFNYLDAIKIKMLDSVDNCIVRTTCKMKGISIGKGCEFKGIPYIQLQKGAISIGNNCVFRSRETSNKIGLNHICMLTTAKEAGLIGIVIGNNCGFSGVTIRCFKSIKIGNNVRVGANSMLIDGDSHFNDTRIAPPAEIVIEDNVFIGANCTIKKGVTIGKNSVIGMHSVVTHDIPANSVAVGIPAKVIKTIES